MTLLSWPFTGTSTQETLGSFVVPAWSNAGKSIHLEACGLLFTGCLWPVALFLSH